MLARGRLRGGETLRSEAAPDELRRRGGRGAGRRPLAGGPRPASRSRSPLLLARHGETPLPPYITDRPGRPRALPDRLRAPAGLGRRADRRPALHARPGRRAARAPASSSSTSRCTSAWRTFKPVTAARLEDHPLHEEPLRRRPRRVAAHRGGPRRRAARRGCGHHHGAPARGAGRRCRRRAGPAAGATRRRRRACADAGVVEGRTGLFIPPGHRFAVVDGLITNFHLPRTSLLAPGHGVLRRRRDQAHLRATRWRGATASTASATPCWPGAAGKRALRRAAPRAGARARAGAEGASPAGGSRSGR